MNAQVKVLQELVRDSLYPVDESAVANAILSRARARRALCDALPESPLAPSSPRRTVRSHTLRGWLLSGD